MTPAPHPAKHFADARLVRAARQPYSRVHDARRDGGAQVLQAVRHDL